MKPFDLEAAKRGEPIVSRSGRPVRFIAHIPDLESQNRVVVVIDNELLAVKENGRAFDKVDLSNDLFMAPKKRTVWFNVYKQGGVNLVPGAFCASKEDAQYLSKMGPTVIKGSPFSIEIEE